LFRLISYSNTVNKKSCSSPSLIKISLLDIIINNKLKLRIYSFSDITQRIYSVFIKSRLYKEFRKSCLNHALTNAFWKAKNILLRQKCLTQPDNFTIWAHFLHVCDKNLYETVSHTSCQNCNWVRPKCYFYRQKITLYKVRVLSSLGLSRPNSHFHITIIECRIFNLYYLINQLSTMHYLGPILN
jgi:hypothetical protein